MNNYTQDDRLSTRFGSLPQQAVDEAIEQHRLKGEAIAVSDEQGNPIEIPAQDITPLAQKQKERQKLHKLGSAI